MPPAPPAASAGPTHDRLHHRGVAFLARGHHQIRHVAVNLHGGEEEEGAHGEQDGQGDGAAEPGGQGGQAARAHARRALGPAQRGPGGLQAVAAVAAGAERGQ